MISTTREVRVTERTTVHRLPERLRTGGLLLVTTDCTAALVALVVTGIISGSGAVPFLTLAATLLIASFVGRYRTSFALTQADEWYATYGVAILGGIAGLLLALVLGFDWFAAVGAEIVWAPLAGMCAAHLQGTRRGGVVYEGGLEHVRESRRGTLWHAQQSAMRFLDVLFASIGLIVLAPVMLIVSLVVWRDSGRPIFFRQERVCRDDKSFTMWKFRTMRVDSGDDWAKPNDDRITPTGAFLRRTSLDELPQLWNVLVGDMSLVGPRPEMREYADRFSTEFPSYSQRHIVRPGVTGWAQLVLPRNFQPDDFARVLPYDLFYVQNASVYLYMQCLVKTAFEVFSHRAV